jgi:hypothetical protein
MIRVQARQQTDDGSLYGDGSFDSTLTRSAASMLASVEAYLAEHPDLQGWGRIPARAERPVSAAVKLEA